jgi:hypothetical protein
MTEVNPRDTDTLRLINDIRTRNQAEPVAVGQAEIARQRAIEITADPKMILGKEAVALVDRMWWLYDHPRVARWLGGQAYFMSLDAWSGNSRLYTPLMLGTYINDVEIEGSIHDTRLVDGYKFGASNSSKIKTNPGSLEIDHVSVDKSGARQLVEPWIINFQPAWGGGVAKISLETSGDLDESKDNQNYGLLTGLVMQARAALGRGQILSKVLK